MNGSKPTSPAYCCWRLGGRFKKGIAAEYLERGGGAVVLEGDDTMASGDDVDVDASVMTYSLLCVIYTTCYAIIYSLFMCCVCSLFFAKAFQNALYWWRVAELLSGFVRFEG